MLYVKACPLFRNQGVTSESNISSDFFAPQMVASDEPPSPKVPLLAKFAKPRVPLTNSVSQSLP